MNGQNYYYAVVSYDHGSRELQIPPSECSKTITLNPTTNELITDVNTVRVIPSSPSIGVISGDIKDNIITHKAGVTTGEIFLDIIDPYSLEEENEFEITFLESPTRYSIKDLKPVDDIINISLSQFRQLSQPNIDIGSISVRDEEGNSYDLDYDFELITDLGKIKGLSGGNLSLIHI